MSIRVILFLLFFTLTGCDSKDWNIVSRSGDIKFIEISGAANDKGFYRDVIPKICSKEENCKLLFWKKGEAATSLPLSDADMQSMMAYFANQVEPKKQNLRWNCDVFPSPTQSTCLDPAFIRNATQQ